MTFGRWSVAAVEKRLHSGGMACFTFSGADRTVNRRPYPHSLANSFARFPYDRFNMLRLEPDRSLTAVPRSWHAFSETPAMALVFEMGDSALPRCQCGAETELSITIRGPHRTGYGLALKPRLHSGKQCLPVVVLLRRSYTRFPEVSFWTDSSTFL